MKIRIFIGIFASNSLQKKVKLFQKEFSREETAPIRFLDPGMLHLTLIPPWYAGEDEIENIRTACANASKGIKPITLNFTSISFGPDARQPRLIWISGEESIELSQLKENLQEALGQTAHQRIFLPHVTLARFKPANRKFLKPLNKKINWDEEVKGFSLIKSTLTPTGALYERLADNVL